MAGFPSLTDVKYYTILFFKTNGFRSSLEIPEVHHELDNFITHLAIKSRTWERRDEFHVKVRSSQVTSMRSMAVLSGALLSPPQSLCGFSALARLYYFARPTKTAMLRRLASYEFLKLTSTSKLLLKLNCIFYNGRFTELDWNLQRQNGWQKLSAYFWHTRCEPIYEFTDQVDVMFSKELTLPSGVKSLLIFNFYSTQYSETPIKRTPSGPSQLSA